MKVVRVNEREFGEILADRLGFSGNEPLDAVDVALKAGVRLFADLPVGFNVIDRNTSGVVTLNGLSVFITTAGDGEHLPRFAVLYLDENEELRSWTPTTNNEFASTNAVLDPCGVTDDDVRQRLTSTIVRMFARTTFDVFIHQVQPVDRAQAPEPNSVNDEPTSTNSDDNEYKNRC